MPFIHMAYLLFLTAFNFHNWSFSAFLPLHFIMIALNRHIIFIIIYGTIQLLLELFLKNLDLFKINISKQNNLLFSIF